MADWETAFYKGLQSLMSYAFPRRCARCGAEYQTVEEFLARTGTVRNLSGLRESRYEDGEPIVELFRNCVCGSTLMEVFRDRRDMSRQGRLRRRVFDRILETLIQKGMEREAARRELLKIMRGDESGLLRRKGLSILAGATDNTTVADESESLSDEET
jgi:hypothetical protein